MKLAEDMWLRGRAAQHSFAQLMAYNTAFVGHATMQAWHMGMTAPTGFWAAMGRLGEVDALPVPPAPAPKAKPKPKAAAAPVVAKATPKPKAAAKPAPAPAKAAPKPKAAAKPVVAEAAEPVAPQPAAKPKAAKPAPEAKATTPSKPAAKPKAAAPAAAPVPEAQGPSPHLLDAPRGGKADDLTVLSGVGAKLATALNEFGIYHFDQIARLDAEGIDWLNEQQPGFKMISARYDLVGQAKARVAG